MSLKFPLKLKSLERNACLVKKWIPRKLIGSGEYGTAWTLDENTKSKSGLKWILKVSNLGKSVSRNDAFRREVHFLTLLSKTGLVPKLQSSSVCNGSGLQIIQAFDGSFKDLGIEQGKSLKMKKAEAVFNDEQIDNVIELVNRFDQLKIIHGDLKRSNILQSNGGQHLVIADFGYSGTLDGPESKYEPLMGFTQNHGCPFKTLTPDFVHIKLEQPIPREIAPYFNRWQLYRDFIYSRPTFIIQFKKGRPVLERLTPESMAKRLGLTKKVLELIGLYCKKR